MTTKSKKSYELLSHKCGCGALIVASRKQCSLCEQEPLQEAASEAVRAGVKSFTGGRISADVQRQEALIWALEYHLECAQADLRACQREARREAAKL